MENLTPVQRIATIAIGLVLTIAIAIWVLPWVGRQIAAQIPPTKTPVPPTKTPAPTATPTQTPGPTPTPTVAITPPAKAVLLNPVAYKAERPDYCSLAPVGIALQHWGFTDTHDTLEPALCPGDTDSFVSADQISEYMLSRGLQTFVGTNGDVETLQQLLANGFPVIITRWMTATRVITSTRAASTATANEAGHYQVLRGYDQTAQTFTVHDIQIGPDVPLSFKEMEQGWRMFNRQYILVYPITQTARVRVILGTQWDPEAMWQDALTQADKELRDSDQDALAWFNRGSAFVGLQQYEEAKEAFDQAQKLKLPSRLLRYRFELFKCLLQLGVHQSLLSLTQAAIDDGAKVEELHFYRAQSYIALNNITKARAEYQKALEIHPGWTMAASGMAALPQ